MQQTVLHNQTLYDFALQHCGTVAAVFAIALANGISITSELVPGTQLDVPADAPVDADILNFYKAKEVLPATGITELNTEPDGIDFMSIEGTFIVQ